MMMATALGKPSKWTVLRHEEGLCPAPCLHCATADHLVGASLHQTHTPCNRATAAFPRVHGGEEHWLHSPKPCSSAAGSCARISLSTGPTGGTRARPAAATCSRETSQPTRRDGVTPRVPAEILQHLYTCACLYLITI